MQHHHHSTAASLYHVTSPIRANAHPAGTSDDTQHGSNATTTHARFHGTTVAGMMKRSGSIKDTAVEALEDELKSLGATKLHNRRFDAATRKRVIGKIAKYKSMFFYMSYIVVFTMFLGCQHTVDRNNFQASITDFLTKRSSECSSFAGEHCVEFEEIHTWDQALDFVNQSIMMPIWSSGSGEEKGIINQFCSLSKYVIFLQRRADLTEECPHSFENYVENCLYANSEDFSHKSFDITRCTPIVNDSSPENCTVVTHDYDDRFNSMLPRFSLFEPATRQGQFISGIHVNASFNEMQQYMELYQDEWTQETTEATVMFLVASPGLEMILLVSVLFSADTDTGSVHPGFSMWASKELFVSGNIFSLFVEVVLFLFILYFSVVEVHTALFKDQDSSGTEADEHESNHHNHKHKATWKTLCRLCLSACRVLKRLGHFLKSLSFWALVDIGITVAGVFCVMWRILMYTQMGECTRLLNDMDDSGVYHHRNTVPFACLMTLQSRDTMFMTVTCIVYTMSLFRTFKYLDAHPRLGQVTRTISHGWVRISHFALVYVFFVIGYAVLGHYMFGASLDAFAEIPQSIMATILLLDGNIAYEDLAAAWASTSTDLPWYSNLPVQLYFVGYWFIVSLLMLNILLGIVLSAYGDVEGEVLKLNDFEYNLYHEIHDFLRLATSEAAHYLRRLPCVTGCIKEEEDEVSGMDHEAEAHQRRYSWQTKIQEEEGNNAAAAKPEPVLLPDSLRDLSHESNRRAEASALQEMIYTNIQQVGAVSQRLELLENQMQSLLQMQMEMREMLQNSRHLSPHARSPTAARPERSDLHLQNIPLSLQEQL